MRKIVKSLLALSILGVTGGTAAAGAVIFNNATYQPAEETVAAAVATHYISSESDLTQMALNISQGVGVYALDTYQLTNDITLTGALWTPIGTSSKPFKGTFLGNGYTISGNITLDTSTLDSNYGLFGAIEGAKIYDFTLDGSFNYPAAGGTAGSLVGTAKNSIIAAVNIKNVSDLDLIGSSVNNSVYTTGDEGHIGSTARTGRVVTFDANGGYFADGNNKPLTRPKKTATDTNLGTEKRTKYYVALKGTAPQTLNHAPNNFGTVYPVDVNNENVTFKAVRDGYVLNSSTKWLYTHKNESSGKEEVVGWLSTNFDLTELAKANYNLQANWDQVKYTFTFENKAGSVSLSSGTPANVTVPMYMPWSTLVEGGNVSIGGEDTPIAKLSKSGYDLVELKIGDTIYCKRAISYDNSGNQIDGVWSYPNGNNINLGNKHGNFTVTANWQPKQVNLTVQYNYTNGGSSARNSANFSIVEKASNNAFLKNEGTDEGSEKYVVKGAASVRYSFNLKAGYEVDSFVVNGTTISKDTTAESGYAYSYTIKGEAFEGLTANETNRTITVNLKRKPQTITISAPNTTITLSENTKYTSYYDSNGVLTTYAGEKFKITFKADTGYRIKGVTPKGFATETTLTYDSIPLTGKGSISVSIKEYAYTSNSPTITLSTGQVEVAFNVVQTGPKNSNYNYNYPGYDIAGKTTSGRVGYSESLGFITNTNDYYRVSEVKISKFTTTFTSGNNVNLFGTTYTGELNGSVLTMSDGSNSYTGSNGSILISNIDYTYAISGNNITLTYAGSENPTISENAITGTSAYGHYTITITYVKNTKKLTFDANGGSWGIGLPYSVYVVPVSGSLQYTDAAGKNGYAFNGASNQLVPKRTGYTFKGYSLTKNNVDTKIINYNANEETKWSSVSGKTWEAITADTTLYAIWQANTYTVEFDRASGSDGMVRITVTYGSTPSNIRVPKRTGYIFGGYYTKANGYGKQYFDERGTATCVWDIASDTTLYEQWTPISYKIIYSNCDVNQTTATYDKGFKVTNPTKTGYTFTGWTITGMDTTTHVIGGKETTAASAENVMATTFKNLHSTDGATVNFKANWNPITYDINYTLNNGSEAAQTTAIYDVEFTVANPTKTGYTFTGWTITGMDTTKHVIGEETITDESKSGVMATNFKNLHSTNGAKVNFEANWKAKEYNLTYNGNGTTTGVPSGNTISYGGSMLPSSNPTSSNPTRTGYLFAGWAINKNYDNKNHTYIFNLQNGATKDSFKARVNGSDAIITVLSGTNFSTDNFGTDAAATALFGDTDITVYALWILDAANLKLKYTEITAVSAINSVEGKYPAWKPAITSIGDSLQYLITSYNGDNVTFKIEPYYEGKVFVDGLASTSFKKEHKLERGSSGTLSYEDKLVSLDTVVLPFKDTTLTGTLEYSTTFVANIYNKTANGGIKNIADNDTYESLAEMAARYYTMRLGPVSADIYSGLNALQDLINRNATLKANIGSIYETLPDETLPEDITSLVDPYKVYKVLCTSMNVLGTFHAPCYMTNIPGVTIAGVGYFNENNEFVSFENGSVGVHDTWYKLAGVTPTLLEGVDQTDQTHMRAVNGTYYIRNNATVYGTKYNTQIEAPQTNINLDSATMIYEGNKEYSYVVEQGGVKYTISTTSAVGTGTYQQPAIQVTKVGNETADNVNNYYYINGSLNIVNLGTLKEQTLSLSGVSASDDHTTISTSNEIGNCSISITSITYNGTGYPYNKDKTPTSFTIDANNVVWIGSNVIGIIQGNGGQNTTVKFINGVTSFKYTVTGIGDYENSNCKILEFTKQVNDETSVSLENIAAALKSVANLKNLTDNSIDALVYDNDTSTYTGANQIYIYLTRAAAVTVSTTFDVWNGDGQTTLSKTIFMNVTDTDVVFNPAFERAGYDLTGIKPVSNVMDVTDGFTLNFNANNASRVNPVTIEVIWTPKKAADIEINNATSKEFTANETERTAFSASSFIESVTGFKPSEYDCTWVKTGTDTLELLNSDDAGEYTINIKLKDYNVTYTTKINITCNLQEVSMTVRDSSNNNLGNSTYDGTDKIFGYNILLSNNLVKTGTDAYFTLAWSKDNADVTEAKNVGTYKLTVKLTELGKKVYKFAGDAPELTFSFEISKAALTLSNVTKVYDGTTAFDSSMGKLNGVVDSETITVTGTFDSKDVATATKVSGLTINGETASNYTIETEVVAKITTRSLTLTDVTKVYDGTTAFDSSKSSNTLTITEIVSGEESYIYITGTFANAGPDEEISITGLTINSSNESYPASNYELESESSTGTITKASSDEITASLKDFIYGEIKAESDIKIEDFTFANGNSGLLENASIKSITISNSTNLSTGGYLKAGTYSVEVTITSKTIKEFTLQNVGLTINAKDLTITFDDTKMYDGTTSVSSSSEGMLPGDEVGTTLTYGNKNVGTNIAITKSAGADDSNYNFIYKVGEVTVTSLVGDITAYEYELKDVSLSKFFNQTTPVLTATRSTVNGEELTFTFNKSVGEEIGSYNLTITKVSVKESETISNDYTVIAVENGTNLVYTFGNYKVTIVKENKWFEIKERNSAILIYADTTNEFKMTYNGQVASLSKEFKDSQWNLVVTRGEETVSIPLTLKYFDTDNTYKNITEGLSTILDSVYFTVSEIKDAGEYKITVSGNSTEFTGAAQFIDVNGDTAEVSFTMNKAALTLSNVTKVYDGTTDFDSSMGTLSGVVGGEDIAVTGKFDSKDVTATKVSDFTINGETASNYTIDTAVSAIITPKALTLIDVTKVYDGTTDFDSSMGTLSGVVGGEDIAVTGKFDSKDVTATKVSDFTIVGDTKDNYSIKAEFSAIITPKALTLIDVTKVYDGTTAFDSSMGTLSGVVGDEDITVTGEFDSKDVTATKVSGLTINGETASNYTIKTEVDATISPKKLTITVEKEYDGSEGFTNEKATIEGLVSIDEVSDEVTVKGNFSNANVKASEIITDYVLGGKDAGNYTVESITGTINKITDISGFGIKGVSYTYREMLKPADNKWETNLNGIDLKFTKGGAETTLVSGNITFEIKANDILDESYSVGGALKVGKYNITLTIKSDTVEDFDAVLTIEITKLDITVELRKGADNLTKLSKIYDGTADLPAGIIPYADFKGDNVEIAAKFENAKVGENKNIIYSVTGDDKDNYNYTYSIKTGTIGKFEFTKITLNNSNGNIGFVDGDVTGNVEITDKYELNESFNPSNFIATLNSKMNGVSKVGYTRATKWYTDANFYEEITEENITKILMRYASQNISEITFYSQWERNSWNLTLDGNTAGSISVLYYDELGEKLTTPTLTGYAFQGWFDGETQYTETSKMPNNDLVLTSKWVENKYIVKFDGNGATAGEMADREFTYDSTTIPVCAFRKTGYTFSGWNTLQTPTEENPGTAYKEGDKNLITEGEITLYAQWVANKYTVVLDLNNGSFNEAPVDWTKNADGNYERKVSYDESFVLPVPTKEEYNFNGWKFGEETKNGTVLNLTDINNGSVKLVAQWTKGDYTLTVNLVDEAENQISNSGIAYYTISLEDGTSVGANVGANNEFTLNKDKVYKITVVTGAGYSFAEYTVNPEGALTVEREETVLILKAINSATSITIKITENKYTITASANGGTFDETQLNDWTLSVDKLSATKTISFSASYFPMPVVTRKGYTFKGWFVGVTKIEDSTALSTAGDHSVEARWEANTYDVTINYNGDHVTVKRVDGQNEYDVADGKLNVKTGDIIALKATAKQHYENVQVKAEGVTVISNAETSQYTISGFTEAFTIDITADPVKYSVEIDMIAVSGNQVQSETSNSARLAVSETVYVDNSGKLDIAYGSSYTYTATLATGYEFDGWYDSVTVVDGIVTARGNKISEALTYAGTVSGDYKLIAIFKLGEFDVKVKVDGEHGTFNYGSVENQSEYTTKIQLDSTVIITPVTARGYEFKEWLLDGVVLTESNTEKGIAYAADGALTLTGKANIDLQVRFTPSSGSFEMDTELSINGIVIDGSASGCVATRVGTLDASGNFVANDSIPPFMNGTIPFVTDTDVYLQIEVSYGYSFNGLITVGTGDTKTIIVDSDYNPAATTVGTGLDQKTIYVRKIKNLNSADNYGTLRVKIEAVAVSLTVNFISDNREVNAGRIFVDDERFGIITSGNTGPSVTIQAMITEEIDITAFTRFNYTIVESDYYKLTRTATITNTLRETVTDRRNGFTSSFKFSVSKYVMGTVVSIKVIPEVYNVELYDGATKIGETITGVKAGDRLNTSNHIDLISELATSRAGYELKGFYTAENGCGELYIDGQGICGKAWEETGFYWDGENYQISPSYNSATNAIKLYAGWARWKSAVTLYTAPKALRELAPTVAATQVITSLNTANSWTTAGNIFFADILYGADVIIEAPVYENYVFNCWTIILDGVKQDPIYESVYFKEGGFNSRVVDIYANYNTKVILEAGNGGTAKLIAGETVIEAGNEGYIPTNVPFTLIATPDEGYTFAGWYNVFNDELISTEERYVYPASDDNEIGAMTIQARFTGKPVQISVGDYDKTYGYIQKVYLNSELKTQGHELEPIDAKMGDVVEFYVILSTMKKYGVKWNSDNIAYYGRENIDKANQICYIYRYIVSVEDVKDNKIVIVPTITEELITIKVEVKLNDNSDYTEAGEVEVDGLVNDTISISYGSQLDITVKVNDYYRIRSVQLDNRSIGEYLAGDVLSIPSSILNELGTGVHVLKIEFAEKLWIESNNLPSSLEGDGTERSPYIIATAEDLAFLAYKLNKEKDQSYANSRFILVNDISLIGKFWNPIGVDDCKYNSVFNFNGFKVYGLRLASDVDESRTTYNGVFYEIGQKAEIILNNNALVIVAVSVSVGVALIIIGVVVYLVVRRRRKKRMEELSNG